MEFDKAARRLDGLKFTTPQNGRVLYDFILEEKPKTILEMGFHHGVSTCYMAAALDELGRGHITTLDQRASREKDPSLPQLLDELGLADYVTPVFAERSLTWELYKLLAADPRPSFDFMFHDADHTWDITAWDITALSFFSMDKMISDGGWMLFDDYKWCVDRASPTWTGNPDKYSADERATSAVAEVFRLLIEPDPRYESIEFSNHGNWAWVRKRRPSPS